MSQHPETTRLAPSPTGALHLGNARTFLVNWAMARRADWRIILRLEDLDTPRIKPGAAAALLDTLRWLGMDWDPDPDVPDQGAGPGVLVQSANIAAYTHEMRCLAGLGMAYPCHLSRTQVDAAASAPQEGAHETPYPASLRPPIAGQPLDFDFPPPGQGSALGEGQRPNWRFCTPPGVVEFEDAFAGPQRIDPAATVGDFVLWTRRGQPSYQLAVVVDDNRQGVTQIVRGDDLLDSAARQLQIRRALDMEPEPTFTHLPLVLGPDGRRLAKRHGDTRIETYRAAGIPPEAVIGLVAFWCGVLPRRKRLSAPEFRAGLDLSTIKRSPITFTDEDDQWLRSQSR
ncbi:MAG: hypothetical protein KF869_03020 [Phycisphaeraceae bacterium]|nr:hypothetical protein [Phycisphaeraceae bacterium]